jgi:polyisoprenoid-binding protein YceI
MKIRFTAALFLMAPVLFAQVPKAPAANSNEWNIAPLDSSANFSVKHLVVSTEHGSMSGMKGKVIYDPKDPSKDSVEATLDVATINTNNQKRDDQLKSDFFDQPHFPQIIFKSTKVWKDGSGNLQMSGNLTIKGHTKPVVLAVEGPSPAVKDAQGRTKIAVSATTKISRKDFDIVGTPLDGAIETGGIVVSDEVSLELDLELVPPSQAGIIGPAAH